MNVHHLAGTAWFAIRDCAMSDNIYKYISSDVFNLVFQRDGFCGVKCSFPKDYNDPFELFLGVDLTVTPELLATYRDIVQDLPQYPTTCFSKSPIVTPMWAHYAGNHSGFVLEFDAKALRHSFERIAIRNVAYKDEPDQSIVQSLQRAAVIAKPRHAIWLQSEVLGQAYFSKHKAWSYEQECRLVDEYGYSEDVAGNWILFMPIECITSVIVGRNFPAALLDATLTIAQDNELGWYRSNIGKSHAMPFLTDRADEVFVFNGENIEPAEHVCKSCSEPLAANRELCPWCSITEEDEIDAADRNPLRILDHFGELEGYYDAIDKIRGK
jgi:hypothetical protein